MRGAVAGLVVGVLAIALGIVAGSAHAADCDPGPTVGYSGSDDAAAQLHAQRLEQAVDCSAVTERLDALQSGANITADKLQALRGDIGQVAADLTPPGGVPVSMSGDNISGANVELGPQSSLQLDDAARAVHGDLWILIGVFVGMTILVFVLNRVWL